MQERNGHKTDQNCKVLFKKLEDVEKNDKRYERTTYTYIRIIKIQK